MEDSGTNPNLIVRSATQLQSDYEYRGLLEAVPDAMVIVNADSKIVLVNAQAERIFGYPRAGSERQEQALAHRIIRHQQRRFEDD